MSESKSPSVEKIVIIGSGPASWTAAIYAARASLSPLVYEGAFTETNQMKNLLPMGQLALTTEVENYPGFPPANLGVFLESAISEERRMMLGPHEGETVTGPELVELIRAQAVHFGTRVVENEIVSVDFSQRPFRLTSGDGSEVLTQTVIVATGATANYLGLPSENAFKNRGVSACAVCDGALPRFRNHPVVVAGGGDSAVEEADYLAKFASKVYLVHRRDQLRASAIMAKRAMEHPKIEILWNRTVAEILGTDTDGVTGVRLASTVGEPEITLTASGFFAAIGHTPTTAFLNGQLELTDKKYIHRPLPHRQQTSVSGVFAAGDVADEYYRQAITAAASGAQAALEAERFLVQNS